jgi:hypothetical protein
MTSRAFPPWSLLVVCLSGMALASEQPVTIQDSRLGLTQLDWLSEPRHVGLSCAVEFLWPWLGLVVWLLAGFFLSMRARKRRKTSPLTAQCTRLDIFGITINSPPR